MQGIAMLSLTMTLSYKHSHAISHFNLRFWLSAWRKWRNLNSTLTTSGTLKVRIVKYKQTMVFDDHTVKLLLEDIFAMSALPYFEFYMLDLG